jgi:hypothetical protein
MTTLDNLARGEAKTYKFQCRNADATVMDLTGLKVIATLRLDDTIVVTKKSATIAGGGDEQLEVTALGIAKVKFAPADTSALAPCWLDGDLWVYTGAADPVRLMKFRLPVDQAQTRTFP